MQLLASYLAGQWSTGSGTRVPLVNPATEEVVAEVASGGHDLGAAFSADLQTLMGHGGIGFGRM